MTELQKDRIQFLKQKYMKKKAKQTSTLRTFCSFLYTSLWPPSSVMGLFATKFSNIAYR